MKKKMNWVMAVACAAVVTVSCIIPAAAAVTPNEAASEGPMAAVSVGYDGFVSCVDAVDETNDSEGIVIEGEVGDKFVVGDLIFEIVSAEEAERAISGPQTRASTKRWDIELEGDTINESFEVTKDYPYAKVWIKNDGTKSIQFTITKTSPTGSVVEGSDVTIAAGTSTNVYSTRKWSTATYYANFTSGKADMVGSAACRVASTLKELDL